MAISAVLAPPPCAVALPGALHIVARPIAATPCASLLELIAMAASTCNRLSGCSLSAACAAPPSASDSTRVHSRVAAAWLSSRSWLGSGLGVELGLGFGLGLGLLGVGVGVGSGLGLGVRLGLIN